MKKKDYDFYKSIGICVRCCKRQAEPNMIMCIECADREAERRRRDKADNAKLLSERDKDMQRYYALKKSGICTYCKHEKAIDGKTKCYNCLAKIRSKRNARKGDIVRSEYISYGKCYTCGKEPVKENQGVCEACYQTRLTAIKQCVEKRRKNNEW